MRQGGDVRVSQIRAWVVVTTSDHGVAYGASFGTSHPHNFQVVADGSISALEAVYMAVCGVVETVPTYLTLYVVCLPQRHIDLLVSMDTWYSNEWRYSDESPFRGLECSINCTRKWRTGNPKFT